jgi:hypothetical protein
MHRQTKVSWSGESRWTNKKKDQIYTYDSLHGEVEVFNKRGRHLGALDPDTGVFIKDPVPGRSIDV